MKPTNEGGGLGPAAYWTVLASLAALILTLSLTAFMAPGGIAIWLIQILPLLCFIPALRRKNIRAYQWLCFLILLYFIQGVLNIFNPERVLPGALVTVFCVTLFGSAVVFVYTDRKARRETEDDADTNQRRENVE